jgi:hypothetical protein
MEGDSVPGKDGCSSNRENSRVADVSREMYEGRQDVRFLKTGCSNNISGDKNMFYELNEGVRKL